MKPLTRLEERILGYVQLGPADSMQDMWRDLSAGESCPYGSVRRAVRKLELRGLVKARHLLGRRGCSVSITAKGRAMCK